MTSVMEIVVRCPSCLDPNRHSEIASIGDWYLTFWTDGWRHPVPPSGSIFRCGSCGYVSFRDEFSDLGPLVRPIRLGDVELVDVGPNRVRVMATLRAAVGLDLSAMRRLVEEMPVIVATDLYFADAKALANALHDNGAACVLHAKELGTSSPASWFDAPQLATARDIATLNRLADLSSRSSVLERHLRMELYWAANHPFRERNYPWIPVSRRCPAERENAKRLFSLLREDDTASRLAKANIARESADFATANHLLATEVFGDLAPMAARLSQLTDSEESALLPLSQDGPDAAQQGNGD